MRRIFMSLAIVGMIATVVSSAMATNGDNLIGIGPISRGMGGVGIAAPQDAISAVFANPAAMCFGPYCPGTQFDFAGTLFRPKVDASVNIGGTQFSAESDRKTYAIPAIGLSVPIDPQWRFGIAAYGVSGLGVDYRGTSLDQPQYTPFGGAPLIAGEYTQLQIMKFAPTIAYQPTNNFSVGLAVQIDYANLDLRNGSSFNYAIGAQLGAIYKPADMVSVGLTYITPQSVNYENVLNFHGSNFNLKLEAPQQVGLGVAVEPIKDTLLFEVNGRWVNWANAKGYEDFDWKDQWVFGIGAQYKPLKQLALRIGYNYANNPVREHTINGFNPSDPAHPPITTVQGIPFPTYYYETFRVIGFPAIVKQHITFGIGYEISKRFAVNAGYTHAFKETLTESGTTFTGQPVTLQSHLSEDSLEFGFTWRF